MKYEMRPVITTREIENAVKAKYGEEVNVCNLFFEWDYANYSYKFLSFDKNSIEWAIEDWNEDPENDTFKQRIHVLELLRDEIKGHNSILIDVSG